MAARTSISALLLLAVGAAAGWVGATLTRSGEHAAGTDAVGEGASDEGEAPGLRSRAGPASDAGDSVLARRLNEALEGKDAASLADAAKRDDVGAPRGARGWSALLTLYAMADQSMEFLRSVPDALRAGLTPGAVLELLRLFPISHQSGVLERLLAGVTDVEWPASRVADIFVEAGDPARAIASLTAALEVAPHRALIERLVRIDRDRAAQVLLRLATEKAWTTDRIEQIGDEFTSGGHPELAIAFFQAALAKEPLDRSALERLGTIAPALAISFARRLTQERGSSPSAWLSLGALEQKAGNAQAAFDSYRQAASRELTRDALYGLLKADPARAYAAAMELVSKETDDEALGVIAVLALAGDRATESMDALLRAHERDPSDYKWSAALVDLDPRRAAEVLAASVESYRGRRRDEVVGAYADALLETGNARAAYDQFRSAFELDPDDGSWQAGLARSDPVKALPILEERRRAVGDSGDLLGALADAYAGSGRREEALALYEQAAQRDGGLKWVGRMALVDAAGARARIDAAISREPKSDAAWGALGDFHRALGNATAARDAYARARDLDPSNLTWEARLRAAASRTH